MKQSVTLKLGQHLTMTPALQQAIRLLQLSTLDLSQEIQQLLDSNPLLEREDDASTVASETEVELNGAEHGEEPRDGDQIPSELPVDADWDDIYTGGSPAPPASADGDDSAWEYRQSIMHESPGLHDHLLWQASLSGLNETDETIAAHIIDLIDEDGYLHEWDALVQRLTQALSVSAQRLEDVLSVVQGFDPAGVAARDLPECLRLQLEQLPRGTPDVALALNVVEHLNLLAQRDLGVLATRTGAEDGALERAIALIQSLTPRPGSPFSAHEDGYVVPEVLVNKHEGRWLVSLNTDALPRLRINPFYQGMIRRADKSDDQIYLKQNLQEARYFLNSLKSRNETLLRVAQCIVEEQRPFLDYGDEAMRPLVLRDVAVKLGVHESTVSRATSNKYMLTPRGLYELKHFFSSGVGTTEGGTVSATAIQAMIRRLIQDETPGNPLSDSRLTQLLLEEGVKVARRTVAKYREAINIPPSHERKRGT